MTDGLKEAHREAIIAAIAANDRVERAVLFGSRATGTNTVTSDVDIALFGDGLTLTDRARLSAVIDEIPMAQSVDLLLYDSINDRKLREHIQSQGVEWYPRVSHQWRQGTYGRVPVSYVEEPLESLCVPERGIQTGPFGSQLHKKDYVSEGTPIVTVEHLGDNRLVHRNLPRVSENDRHRLSKYRLQAGDIVFSRVGSVDRRALVRREEEGWLFSGRCLRVRGDPDLIDRTFLSYFFGLKAFREHIRSIAVGATMPSLNTRLLSSIVVPHPPLHEQRAIAHILGTLDDKIELNRRMNETLEAMARALFKSWFVDFDPVRAKMEGRDTGLPRDIADLFPTRLVDSEIGEIPNGWEVGRVNDICMRIENGGTPKRAMREYWNGDIKWFKTSELVDEPLLESLERITGLGLRKSSCKLWPAGTVLIALYASPTVGRLGILEVSGAANQACCGLIPAPDYGKLFLYYTLFFGRPFFQNIAVGAAQQNISQRIVRDYKIVIPSPDISSAFDNMAKALYLQRVSRQSESHTLSAIRDTLLPKLISGEIRVPDAERALESAT